MVRSPHLLHSKIFLKRGHQYWSELRQKNHSATGMPYLKTVPNSILPIRHPNNCDITTLSPPNQFCYLSLYDVRAVLLESDLPMSTLEYSRAGTTSNSSLDPDTKHSTWYIKDAQGIFVE